MIHNCILPASGKGGVGKSTLCVHLADGAARLGYRILVIDCDRSGDLATNLGYGALSDEGASLHDAVVRNVPLQPLSEVRPGIDVVPGGRQLDGLRRHLSRMEAYGEAYQWELQRVIAPLAANYHLVLIDLPPDLSPTHIAAYTAAHYVVIPTDMDIAGINGLGGVFDTIAEVQSTTNEHLEVLGVALQRVNMQATVELAETVEAIELLLGGRIPLFRPFVRDGGMGMAHLRRWGLTAQQYDAERTEHQAEAQAARLAALPKKKKKGKKKGKKGKDLDEARAREIEAAALDVADPHSAEDHRRALEIIDGGIDLRAHPGGRVDIVEHLANKPRRYAASAADVAREYQELAENILEAYVAAQEQWYATYLPEPAQ